MDINLPDMNGIEATKQIRIVSPESKVLGVSLHNQPTYAKKMMTEGAAGYVTKNSSREEVFSAITEVLKGNKYVCQEIKNILSEQMLNGGEKKVGVHNLSEREIEIIQLIRQGLSSKEIAETLRISIKTVELHRYNLLQKLNVKNSAALVNYVNTRIPDLFL